jgi:tRNA(Ile)-lysidine synthase
MSSAADQLADAVRESGLVEPGSRGVALCSGGADSAGLLAGLVGVCGPERVVALHLNYGLRPDSGEDQRTCEELCAELGAELVVRQAPLSGEGNVQAEARELRYAAAEGVRSERGLDWIASGHTRTDLAETVIYRLASSPGTRPLLGLPARRDRLVRPLLALGGDQLRSLVERAGLPFRDDPSNAESGYARNRIRHQVLPALEEIAPGPEATIAETQAELAEESAALERLAAEALEASGARAAGAIAAAELEALDPALRRLALRALAEHVSGRAVALGRARAAEVMRLAESPEGGVIELGGGVEARIEHGLVRISVGEPEPAEEAALPVPGSCRFGEWRLTAELRQGPPRPSGLDAAYLDPGALGSTLTVRSWRDGDRISPLGLDGSKSLQDVFTDRKVPRSLRRTLPVVTSDDRIVWIAGVAVSSEFAVEPGAPTAAVLKASSSQPL